MIAIRPAATAVLLLLAPLLGACDRGEEGSAAATAEDAAMGGLSPEQIRQQAEAISPAQAAELGIVDTTIHLEQLTSPEDSALVTTPPPVLPDTAS